MFSLTADRPPIYQYWMSKWHLKGWSFAEGQLISLEENINIKIICMKGLTLIRCLNSKMFYKHWLIYLFMIYLTMLSVAQTISVEWLMDNRLESMWKELDIEYF
jgi:hypothetical protein